MPVDSPPADPQIKVSETAAPQGKTEAPFATRDAWLAQAGKLKEEEMVVEGLGRILLTELTGTARAAIQSQSSTGLLADVKRIDLVAYNRAVLLGGIADPSSPPGERRPLFGPGDMDAVMRIGGAKIATVIDAIERLSALGNHQGRAEENSDGPLSAAGTS